MADTALDALGIHGGNIALQHGGSGFDDDDEEIQRT
jgi:hypothetical protein